LHQNKIGPPTRRLAQYKLLGVRERFIEETAPLPHGVASHLICGCGGAFLIIPLIAAGKLKL